MKVSEKGLAIIKKYEGCRLTAYVCPAGKLTIGYGHTKGVKKGQKITQAQAEELGVYVIPMPFYINEKMYLEGVTLTQEEFYEKLKKDEPISTSQPSPADLCDLWDKLLRDYEEIVHIPMSSGLSSSCDTAMGLAMEFEGKVRVVNNQRISVTQRQSVLDAIEMAEKGMSVQEIEEVLMREKLESSIYITVDTLKYLKKGGRITPAAAAIGTVLNLKPVLQIQGDKLDAFSKARGWKSAKKTMLDAMEKDLKERFAGEEVHLEAAYTCSAEEAQEWKAEIEARFPGYDVVMNPLSLSVSCHIGPGALAVACSKKIPELEA